MNRLAASFLPIAALALGASAAPAAALEPPMHAGELAHELDRVAGTTRVLYVAAHPDDENTRLLGWLAGARHVEVAYLSMTRGGGGQNLIGQEQSELLDVIRSEELLAARRTDGALQRFTRMRDFGYSKSADETLAVWGREEALADVVWVIRTFQPDVIITRFSEQPPNHGHHTASAILAREAFAAAADPRRFPEQLERGAQVWQAERLLHNFPVWSGAPAPPKDALEVDVGGYDARLGLSWGELAARSRSQHKSQGFGVPGERGKILERFVHVAGSRPRKDLLEGLSGTWARSGKAGAPLMKALAEARAALARDKPAAALPGLLEAHRLLAALPDSPRVLGARARLVRVIAGAAGLFVRATAPAPLGVPGDKLDIAVELVARGGVPVKLAGIELAGAATARLAFAETLPAGDKKLVTVAATLAADAAISTPHWLAQPPLAGRHVVADARLVAEPSAPPALEVAVELAIHGQPLRVIVPVVHAWTDPVHGERVRSFLVAPPATVTPTREAVLLPGGKAAPVQVRVRAARAGVEGEVSLGLPAGWKATPATHAVALARPGDETTVTFTVTAPKGAAEAIEVRPSLTASGKAWSFREDVIDHPHIPLSLVLQPATLRLVPAALTVPKGLVGYVPGPGDSVAADLAHVGVKLETVDEATLRAGDLGRYAAIVVGIRAYNTREVVRAATPRFLDYVKRGGVVVIQYNTNSRLAPLSAPLGPCELELGRERVTDEKAAVTPLRPKHGLLAAPHKLTAADFDGWVQERGIYFASKWGACWEPLFEIADPGEKPVAGSTLVARHGKGRFVYTGLAFFRQLPAGVPGAYRLLLNLIAAPPGAK